MPWADKSRRRLDNVRSAYDGHYSEWCVSVSMSATNIVNNNAYHCTICLPKFKLCTWLSCRNSSLRHRHHADPFRQRSATWHLSWCFTARERSMDERDSDASTTSLIPQSPFRLRRHSTHPCNVQTTSIKTSTSLTRLTQTLKRTVVPWARVMSWWNHEHGDASASDRRRTGILETALIPTMFW